MKALILIADGFEDVQFHYLLFRFQEEQINTIVVAPHLKEVVGLHGYRVEPDFNFHEVNPSDYDLLVIPGGRSPEKLRLFEEVVHIVRTFMSEDRMVITLDYGAQLLISAQALGNRMITCCPEIRDDVRAADALYSEQAIVVDNHLLSARGTADLPQLVRAILSNLEVFPV